jgi:hypothetical protein
VFEEEGGSNGASLLVLIGLWRFFVFSPGLDSVKLLFFESFYDYRGFVLIILIGLWSFVFFLVFGFFKQKG